MSHTSEDIRAATLSVIKTLQDCGVPENTIVCPDHDAARYAKCTTGGYFSQVAADLKPLCVVRPSDTTEVSCIVRALSEMSKSVQFAIRSGGHMVWGASSIGDSGIVIDLGELRGISYDSETKLASIEPGCRWAEVYRTLEDKYGVVVAGGRVGDVGVGGLILGGGLSWYVARVGFVCDQVKNFEVVLADGSIVNANEKEHSDLWRALKGGSSNFGIVTRFDMATLPGGPIWGSLGVSEAGTGRAHIEALCKFNKTLNDEGGSENMCLLIWGYAPQGGGEEAITVTKFMVNTRGLAHPPEMEESLAVPATVFRSEKLTSNAEFAEGAVMPYGLYSYWQTATLANNPALLEYAMDQHALVVSKLRSASKSPDDFSTMYVLQPIPAIMSERSTQAGGNVVGLQDRIKENAVLFLAGVHVRDPEMRDLAQSLVKGSLDAVEARASQIDGGLVPWRYMNYADGGQDVLGGNGDENLGFVRRVAVKYDPGAFFQTRCPGGFKAA